VKWTRVARDFASSSAHLDFVHLLSVDHVLKVDASLTGSNYAKNLPFLTATKSRLEGLCRENISKRRDTREISR